MKNRIQIIGKDGQRKAEALGENQVVLAWEGQYEEGDQIILQMKETGKFYVIRLDDCLDESLVYLTREKLTYTVPFEEKRFSYNL